MSEISTCPVAMVIWEKITTTQHYSRFAQIPNWTVRKLNCYFTMLDRTPQVHFPLDNLTLEPTGPVGNMKLLISYTVKGSIPAILLCILSMGDFNTISGNHPIFGTRTIISTLHLHHALLCLVGMQFFHWIIYYNPGLDDENILSLQALKNHCRKQWRIQDFP